jgi:SEC-C motif-containing protein
MVILVGQAFSSALALQLALLPRAAPLRWAQVHRRCAPLSMQLLPTEGGTARDGILARASQAALEGDRWTPGETGKGFKRGLQKRKGKAKRSERKAPAAGSGFAKEVDGLKYTRQPKPGTACACGSGNTYAGCCGPLHASGTVADVLQLVRARYTAFRYRQPGFLIATTAEGSDEWKTDAAMWTKELLHMCDSFAFEKLRILSEPSIDDSTATATFSVSLVEKGTVRMFRAVETSAFVLREGSWLYSGGEVRYEDDKEED